jgi:hypothetical protein
MTIAKSKVSRPYAPDYVDAATLAYRLSLSESTIEDRVRRGMLPKARDVLGVPRWKWSEVESLIDRGDSVETDAFMERLNA